MKGLVVIDDEADHSTPNGRINQGERTKINTEVGKLLGSDGRYIGVTATPARLDLNKTFENNPEKWVQFRPHANYTGQDVFFPLDRKVSYRLTKLDGPGSEHEAVRAFVRFLVSVAYLNTTSGKDENYTFLVHTSGKTTVHQEDKETVERSVRSLLSSESAEFEELVKQVFEEAKSLYPDADPRRLTTYVLQNASRASLIVLNSERDRKAAGDNPTIPRSPFTVIIGGNIVSRGVTFPNLLGMFFTRTVQQRLQQDTYIQRARMFGARGRYLTHFELTIPHQLYEDWHRCFVFHTLALATIKTNLGSPVWIGDQGIAVAAGSSINRATVALDRGEMSFSIFDFVEQLDTLAENAPSDVSTLEVMRSIVGNEALPQFLLDYINVDLMTFPGSLAIHKSSSIANWKGEVDHNAISRKKGFIGKSDRESAKFPNARHHVKIYRNAGGKARIFYKLKGLQFMQNQAGMVAL